MVSTRLDCSALTVEHPTSNCTFVVKLSLFTDRSKIAEGQNALGDVELGYRLVGNAHEDVLTAFEATLKAVYIHLTRLSEPVDARADVGNEFQNVERARKRFLELGINPFDGVSESDLILLMDCIQKRHVIGHNLGMTDGRYLSLSTPKRATS